MELLPSLKKALEIIRNKLNKIFNTNVNNYWINRISIIKSHKFPN